MLKSVGMKKIQPLPKEEEEEVSFRSENEME